MSSSLPQTEPQSVENDLSESLSALKDLERYASSILLDLPDRTALPGRELYLLGIYASMLAQVRGILRLMENEQYRVCRTLFRTMYELWVTIRYVYCLPRSHLHICLLVVVSARRELQRLEADETIGKTTAEDCAQQREALARYTSILKRRYPKWPYPDELKYMLRLAKDPSAQNKMTFEKYSQTIDYFDAKFHRNKRKGHVPLETFYRSLYDFLSAGPHGDPRELGSVFYTTPDGIGVDADGKLDVDGALRLSTAVFALFYECVVTARSRTLREKKPKMPSWIDVHARKIEIID